MIFPRQHCRLNICCYIGWIDKYWILQMEMPLSAPEYWLEWTKNYFRCQFTHVGELIHKETWSAASFGWAEGLQMINPPIYRLTTAVSDIDQTNINRDIRDGNWLSMLSDGFLPQAGSRSVQFVCHLFFLVSLRLFVLRRRFMLEFWWLSWICHFLSPFSRRLYLCHHKGC